jgi:hypothetical protein
MPAIASGPELQSDVHYGIKAFDILQFRPRKAVALRY